jgi:dihydroneopterin triphosphate diphosphatase
MPSIISNSVQVHISRQLPDNKEFEFLVIQRSEDREIYPLLWQVVTGWINYGEKAVDAALRETEEETGLKPVRFWVIPYISTFFNSNTDKINAAPVFGMLVPFNSKVQLSDEHQNYEWLNFNDCLKKLEFPTHSEGTKIFMEYILKSKDWGRFEIQLRNQHFPN